MKTLLSLLLATFALGCQASTPACSPADPGTEPKADPGTAPSVEAGADVLRIDAGGWPMSNTHQWGARFYELRRDGDRVQLRIHDAVDFQGVGMTPEQMPPTSHVCSTWQDLPQQVGTEARARLLSEPGEEPVTCSDLGDACGSIQRWLESTTPPAPADADERALAEAWPRSVYYGRAFGACR